MPISGYPVSAHPISANIPPVVTTPTTVALDWLVRWNDPPLLKAHRTSQQHSHVLGQPPIIPTTSWFSGLTDPIRIRRALQFQQDTLAPVQPTPAAFTFYPMALIEPFINVKPRVVTYGPVLSGLPRPAPPTGGDPFFANTVLLANFNGTAGQTSWNDQSAAANGAALFGGTVSITGTNTLFGNNTVENDGSVFNRIRWTNNPSQYNFGTNPFTIEAWIFPTTDFTSQHEIIGQWGPNFNWLFWYESLGIKWSNLSSNTDMVFAIPGGFLNNWHFMAIDFDGSKQRMYFDGNTVASASVVRNLNAGGTAISLTGDTSGGSLIMIGSMGPVRVTAGVARYASDTTITVPTNIFPTS